MQISDRDPVTILLGLFQPAQISRKAEVFMKEEVTLWTPNPKTERRTMILRVLPRFLKHTQIPNAITLNPKILIFRRTSDLLIFTFFVR